MNKYHSHTVAAVMVGAGIFLCGAAPEPAAAPKNPELVLAEEHFENRNFAKAFQIFQKLAEAGDPEAAAWLGTCYFEGCGTRPDDDKAYEYFELAARKNNPRGMTGLGLCYESGRGTPKNLQEAFRLYQKAADLDHPRAALFVALTCANSESGFFDAQKAEVYFKKAIALGDPSAPISYAEFLREQKRYREAIALARKYPDHPRAMYVLAMCYQYGTGVKIDIAKAAELAEKHHRVAGAAPWSAETCFYAGLEEFIIRDRVKHARVQRRFKCAAEQGHATAQYYYAKFLADDSDHAGALTYMLKAADQGYHPAMLEAGKMFAARKNYSEAIKYFMLATTSAKPELRRAAVERISGIYHFELKTPKAAEPWDVMGMSLGSDFCRNRIAEGELRINDGEHFAKAAARFTEGMINRNTDAIKRLNYILDQNYETLRRLADNNNADALFVLGVVGCLEKPSIPIGLELLERAANLNHAAACRILGNIHLAGKIAKRDLKKSFDWYCKGADAGDTESARLAARMLFNLRGGMFRDAELDTFKKVFDKALSLEAFDVACEYGLIMEERAKDRNRARELYNLAANHNDIRAMFCLHKLTAPDDLDQAVRLLRQAADREDSAAELETGNWYRHSKHPQPRNAFIYYLRANLHGDEKDAPYKLAECWLTGYGCDINYDYFWKSAEKAFKNGCVEVCHLLGTVYRDGKIRPRDLDKAKAYFQEGAKRGSKRCAEELKKF